MRYCSVDPVYDRRNAYHMNLAFCWLLGSCVGIFFCIKADIPFFLLMRSIPFGSVSIVALLSVALLPFLISAFSAHWLRSYGLNLVSFWESFFSVFLSLGIQCAFGTSGWLMCGLLLFLHSLIMPLLYHYWLQCLKRPSESYAMLTVYGSAVILVVSVYYCVLLPYLAAWIIL